MVAREARDHFPLQRNLLEPHVGAGVPLAGAAWPGPQSRVGCVFSE